MSKVFVVHRIGEEVGIKTEQLDSFMFSPQNQNLKECEWTEGKEIKELFSAHCETPTRGHHRKISSINPIFTEASTKKLKLESPNVQLRSEDSLYIVDETNLEDLPSFNLPKNMKIAPKMKFSSIITPCKPKAFQYHPKFTHHSASPVRPTKIFRNKFSFLSSSKKPNIVIMKNVKIKLKGVEKPSKAVPLKPSESEASIWTETEGGDTARGVQTPSFH